MVPPLGRWWTSGLYPPGIQHTNHVNNVSTLSRTVCDYNANTSTCYTIMPVVSPLPV